MTHETVFVGIDVAKAMLDVTFWPAGERLRVGNDREGLEVLLARLAGHPAERTMVGLEASGGYERLAVATLITAGLRVRRVDPYQVRQFARATGRRAKNDRLDADVIARFVATVPGREVMPHEGAERLAELAGARRALGEEAVRVANRAGTLVDPLLQRLNAERRLAIAAEIALIDARIDELVAADEAFARKAALLASVPGIGPVTTHTLLARMPELGTLDRREIASLAGLAPFDDESGRRTGGRHIAGGREDVRRTLYMAAMAAVRHNPVLAAFHTRLKTNGKRPKVALVAAMRKLLTILNAMLKTGTTWTPHAA